MPPKRPSQNLPKIGKCPNLHARLLQPLTMELIHSYAMTAWFLHAKQHRTDNKTISSFYFLLKVRREKKTCDSI